MNSDQYLHLISLLTRIEEKVDTLIEIKTNEELEGIEFEEEYDL